MDSSMLLFIYAITAIILCLAFLGEYLALLINFLPLWFTVQPADFNLIAGYIFGISLPLILLWFMAGSLIISIFATASIFIYIGFGYVWPAFIMFFVIILFGNEDEKS